MSVTGCPLAPTGDPQDDDISDDDDDDDDAAARVPVDVLWIVDSSQSMAEHQALLASRFEVLLDTLGPLDLDVRMGLTTTQATPCALEDPDLECVDSVGTMGRLRGLGNTGIEVSEPPTFLTASSPDAAVEFGALSSVGLHGSTEEYGLWVAAEAVCASLELPYDSDFTGWEVDRPHVCSGSNWPESHEWTEHCGCLPDEARDYNVDAGGSRFLRDGAALVVAIVSDEGDFTPMLGWDGDGWPWDITDCQMGERWPAEIRDLCAGNPDILCQNYCKLDHTLAFFDTLDRRVVFNVFGPGARIQTDGAGNWTIHVSCNEQNSTTTMLEYYLWAVELTGGVYVPLRIRDGDEACEDNDLDQGMAALAEVIADASEGR